MTEEQKISVEVWSARASLNEPGELERRCRNWLGPGEWERALRFRQASSRNQHVVGRGMARRLLTQPSLEEPARIVLDWSDHGKPFIVSPRELIKPFNVTHTEGMVLVGIGNRGLIGIDVERLSRTPDIGLARRFFAAPEVDYVMGKSDPDARRAAFLRVWTLKESFIKAIGTGLSMPLADFAFERIDEPNPSVRMLRRGLAPATNWSFLTFSPADGYLAAIAIGEPGMPVEDAVPRPAGPHEWVLNRFENLLAADRSPIAPPST